MKNGSDVNGIVRVDCSSEIEMCGWIGVCVEMDLWKCVSVKLI